MKCKQTAETFKSSKNNNFRAKNTVNLTNHVAFWSIPHKCSFPFWATKIFPLHFSIFEAKMVSKRNANVWPTYRRLNNCWCWTIRRNRPNLKKRREAKSWARPTIRANCFEVVFRSTRDDLTFWFHGQPNSIWILRFWSWNIKKK